MVRLIYYLRMGSFLLLDIFCIYFLVLLLPINISIVFILFVKICRDYNYKSVNINIINQGFET